MADSHDFTVSLAICFDLANFFMPNYDSGDSACMPKPLINDAYLKHFWAVSESGVEGSSGIGSIPAPSIAKLPISMAIF